jgi:hypothetical protein
MNQRVNQLHARVSPFQGWGGFGGRLSQGVALGCCLIAPLARQFVPPALAPQFMGPALAREFVPRRGKTHQPRATPWELGHPTIISPERAPLLCPNPYPRSWFT